MSDAQPDRAASRVPASPAPPASQAPTPAPPAARAKPRPSPAARRFGYLVGAAVNIAFWVVIHVWPGWQEASFLTPETTDVLPWVDAQIWLAVAVNVLWLVVDPPWLRALGDAVTAAVGVAVTVRILTVFPFSFDDDGVPWEQWVRFALVVAVVGAVIGVLANLVALVRALRRPADAGAS